MPGRPGPARCARRRCRARARGARPPAVQRDRPGPPGLRRPPLVRPVADPPPQPRRREGQRRAWRAGRRRRDGQAPPRHARGGRRSLRQAVRHLHGRPARRRGRRGAAGALPHHDPGPAQGRPGRAAPNPALGVYQQGGGRLDLGRAVAQTITAETPTLDFGLVSFPHQARRFERTATFRNHGGAETTVTLAASLAGPDGQPAPPGTLTLSAQSLTIPPAGTASVTASLTEPQATGLYSGRLTATTADTVIGIPIGLYNEHARANLTIRALDGTGAPANAEVSVYKID
jgi:hypothetical protein